ncbi:hypothetical protein Salat_2364300 [Sesamum alatum]|uniref:Uncharacterized protein n=1 Tax=Sesamum alatum TaxID=300844 RepID=A0AAE1XWY8_9LAMI|nr:hypothetical protein Salat_2364300 [Sesamum alatum]
MERTFVLALVEHARAGRFRSGRRNKDALDFAIGEVNHVHGSRVAESWGEIRIVSLRDRYIVFTWLINLDEVICNRNLRYVIAPDHVWKRVCKEKKLAKCYINAFEDLYNELCLVFGPENAMGNEGPIDLNAPPHEPVDGDASPIIPHLTGTVPVIVHISDSSGSSSFLWKGIDLYSWKVMRIPCCLHLVSHVLF